MTNQLEQQMNEKQNASKSISQIGFDINLKCKLELNFHFENEV